MNDQSPRAMPYAIDVQLPLRSSRSIDLIHALSYPLSDAAADPGAVKSGFLAFLAAVKQLQGAGRHDRRDCMLVNQLGMRITPQQNGKIVEPGHNALKLDTVHQEDRDRHLAFTDAV
jgi:hypothetical protein